MNNVLNWLNGLLMPILPADIYNRLDLLYNGSIILLGAGVVLLLVATEITCSFYQLLVSLLPKNRNRA